MPDFNELVKNLYTSKDRELTQEKLDYINKTYTGKEEDFVKNFYATVGEELPQEKLDYISSTYLSKKTPAVPSFSTDMSNTNTLPVMKNSPLQANVAEVVIDKPMKTAKNLLLEKAVKENYSAPLEGVNSNVNAFDDYTTREARKQRMGAYTSNLMAAIEKEPDLYIKKASTSNYGKQFVPETPNIENISKAIDLYAEKIKKTTGDEITAYDKQYLVNSVAEQVKNRKDIGTKVALTNLEATKKLGMPLTAFTGVKDEKGNVITKGIFEKANEKIIKEQDKEIQNYKTSSENLTKNVAAQVAPEVNALKLEVKSKADILNQEVSATFNKLFEEKDKALYAQYNQLVQSGQMTAEQANQELKLKREEIQVQTQAEVTAAFVPKFDELNKEVNLKSKDIQSRYNRNYLAKANLLKEAADKKLQEIAKNNAVDLPKGYMEAYGKIFQEQSAIVDKQNINKAYLDAKNTPLSARMTKAMTAGFGDVLGSIGGAMSYAGLDASAINDVVIKTAMQNELASGAYYQIKDEEAKAKGEEYGNFIEKLSDSSWWIDNGVRSVPFMLATMPVGMAAGYGAGALARLLGASKRAAVISSVVGGGTVSWAGEATLEAGSAFNDALKQGYSENDASAIASRTFRNNLATLPLSVFQMMPVFSKAFNFTKALAMETVLGGAEEIIQGWSQAEANAAANGFDVSLFEYAKTPQALEEGTIGAAMSSGMSMFALDSTPNIDKQISLLMSSVSVGGEQHARQVLDIMNKSKAITDAQYKEANLQLDYIMNGIESVQNFNVDDNVKVGLVGKFAKIGRAKAMLTDDENDLASQAAKEMIAEQEKEIKEILKGSTPLYLVFEKGNPIPTTTTKEQFDSILKDPKLRNIFTLQAINDDALQSKIDETYKTGAVTEEVTINAEEEIIPATETPATPPSGVSGEVQASGDVDVNIADRSRKDLFPDESRFANEVGQSGENSQISSYKEVNGIGLSEYSNPKNGLVDVIMTGTSGNDYVGYIRIYENGKPTNRWTSKMSNKSGNKANFKAMITEAQKLLPEGHEYTETTNISLDGLRVYANSLSRDYEIATDEDGKPITNNVELNNATLAALQGAKNQQETEDLFDTKRGITRDEFNQIKEQVNKLLPNTRLLFDSANGIVTIQLPVLKSTKKQSTTKQNEKDNKQSTDEANREVVLDRVSEIGNEDEGRKDSEQLREEEVDKPLSEQKAAEVAPKEGDTSTTKSFTGATQKMVFTDGEWQLKVGNIFTKVAKSVQQEAQDAFNENNAPAAEVKEQAPVVKEQAAPPVKAEEKPVKEQKEPVKEQENDVLKDVKSTAKALSSNTLSEDTIDEIEELYLKESGKYKGFFTRMGDLLFTKSKGVDVKNMTQQALKEKGIDPVAFNKERNEFLQNNEKLILSEYYHKAKKEKSDPELVKAVEDLLTGSKKEPVKEQAPVVKEQAAPPVKAEEKPTTKSESFFNDADKLFPNDHVLGGYAVTNSEGTLIGRIQLSEVNDNTVKIDEIVSEKRGQKTGNGTVIMNKVIENADKNNVTLVLTANLIGEMKAKGFETPQKLQAFYEKFGFIKDKSKGTMVRVPKEIATKPTAEEKPVKEQKAPVIETPVIEAPKLEMPVIEETVTEPTAAEEEEEQYEPITVSDTSHDTFTKDNAVDYEEGEREGDNGRSYTYLASVTVELIDDVSGETLGTISKLKDEDGEITWSAETNDGDQVADEVGSKAEAQKALVDNFNKQKLKEFNKEKAKAAKDKIKEAEKAKNKAQKIADKEQKALEKIKEKEARKKKLEDLARESGLDISEDDESPVFSVELNENLAEDQQDEVKKIVEEAISNPEFATSETVNVESELPEGIPMQQIVVDENDTRPEAQMMAQLSIPLEFIFGKSVGVGMSDTLTTGERTVPVMDTKTGKIADKKIREEGGIGYPFKSLMDLINGKLEQGKKAMGWAGVALGASSAMVNAAGKASKITGKELKAHYFKSLELTAEQKKRIEDAIPDKKEYGIVIIYKMGADGIKSNEAYAREAFRLIDVTLSAAEKEDFFKKVKERLAKIAWEDKDIYLDSIKGAKSFLELENILHGENSKMPLLVKTDIINKGILSSDKTESKEDKNPVGFLLKSKGITVESVAANIAEPVMEGITTGQPMLAIAIDPDSTPFEDKTRERHKNYPFGVEGFPIGLFQSTASFHNLAPDMMDVFIKSATTQIQEVKNKKGDKANLEFEKTGKKRDKIITVYEKVKTKEGIVKVAIKDKDGNIIKAKTEEEIWVKLKELGYTPRISISQNLEGNFIAEEGSGTEKTLILDAKGKAITAKTMELLYAKLKKAGVKLDEKFQATRYSQKINGGTFITLLKKAQQALTEIYKNPKLTAQEKLVKHLSKAFPSIVVEMNISEYNKLQEGFIEKKLFTKSGKSYGVVKDGRVYLNPTYLNNNTPIHEFGHIWNAVAKNARPELYKKGADLVKDTKYTQNIINSPSYQKIIKQLFGDKAIIKNKATGKFEINTKAENFESINDYVIDEALARAIGDKGELFVNEVQKRKSFQDWMNLLFDVVKQIAGFPSIGSQEFQDLTIDQFVNAAVKELLGGKQISDITSDNLANLSKESTYAKFSVTDKEKEFRKNALAQGYTNKEIDAILKKAKKPSVAPEGKATENEPTTTTEQAEFTPNAKDIESFKKILGTTSGAIRNKNIAEAVKVNPKIQEIMDNFDELKKQLMASVELTEDCSW
jgi:GNAT superfamily N-acetyltransferase